MESNKRINEMVERAEKIMQIIKPYEGMIILYDGDTGSIVSNHSENMPKIKDIDIENSGTQKS